MKKIKLFAAIAAVGWFYYLIMRAFDRVGFEEYKKWALKGVELDPETIKKDCVYWNGIHFDR